MTAGDVFPRRNLPDDGKGASAEPWGREVETRIEGAEASIQTLSQSLSGQNRSTASSLGDLASQVRDLQGRLGYAVSNTDSSSWTSTQPGNQAWGPVLSFTLTEARTVSVSFIATGGARIAALGTASGYSSIVPTLFVDGGLAGPLQPGITVTLPAGSGASTDIEAPLQARALINLGPGTHTLQGGFQFRQITVNTGSAVGIISARNPQLYVDVLQPAG